MGVRFPPPGHQLKYHYPMWNHGLAALISALRFGVLLGRL
jgi:hypothetical protein